MPRATHDDFGRCRRWGNSGRLTTVGECSSTSKQQSVWAGSSTRSVKILVTTKQQSGRQLLSFKSTVATVFDTVDECNCGVLATQASVGPTRVGCYFLIVIATAGAGGFYRSTGLLAGIVAGSVDNHDRSLGRMVVRRQRPNRQLPLSLTVIQGGLCVGFS